MQDNLASLMSASAPRWAVRATRLYLQAQLAHVDSGTDDQFRQRWRKLRQQTSQLASAHGPRWSELLWEALLTAEWAGPALEAAEP